MIPVCILYILTMEIYTKNGHYKDRKVIKNGLRAGIAGYKHTDTAFVDDNKHKKLIILVSLGNINNKDSRIYLHYHNQCSSK